MMIGEPPLPSLQVEATVSWHPSSPNHICSNHQGLLGLIGTPHR